MAESTEQDKPVSEWSEEERAERAHSDDSSSEGDPGHKDGDDSGDKQELQAYSRAKSEHGDELEGQGKSVQELDGAEREEQDASTPADLGVPTPLDLAPDNVEASVDVNSADVETLTKLRGIGETAAQRIIEHRDEHGPFESINDLQDVEGFERSRVAQLVTQGAYAGSEGS